MTTNTGTIRNKRKMIYFIIGGAGSGKTILAEQIKNKLVKYKKLLERDVIIFDDVYQGINIEKDKEIIKVVAGVRHLNQNVIICLHGCPRSSYNVIDNQYVTWIFTNMSYTNIPAELFFRFGILSNIIIKFQVQVKNAVLGKRKTRPYLLVTLDGNKQVISEFHQFKNKSHVTRS